MKPFNLKGPMEQWTRLKSMVFLNNIYEKNKKYFCHACTKSLVFDDSWCVGNRAFTIQKVVKWNPEKCREIKWKFQRELDVCIVHSDTGIHGKHTLLISYIHIKPTCITRKHFSFMKLFSYYNQVVAFLH